MGTLPDYFSLLFLILVLQEENMVTARGAMTNLKLAGLLSVLTGIFIATGFILGGRGGMFIALVFAAVFNLGSYWFSDRIVLKMYGAEEITEEDSPELHRTLEKLAKDAGIPKPGLYRSDMKVPNAFATGRSPKKGVVCVTDGLMRELSDDEVAGVIAHELAHIKNRDSLINASVATIAGAISILAEMAFWGAMFGRGNDQAGEMASAIVIMILTPIIALLIRTAVSRRMEFRADSDAVKIHGRQEPLASALQKISASNDGARTKASRTKEAGANLFIYNPFSGHKATKYFSTHPPLDKRLDNIRRTEVV